MKSLFSHTFPRFALVGVMGTLLDYGIFWMGIVFGGLHYLVAGVLAFAVATVHNYIWNRSFTFKSERTDKMREFQAYLFVTGIGLLIHMGILFAVVEWLSIAALYGKVFSIVGSVLWNFFGNRHITFRKKRVLDFVEQQSFPYDFSVVLPCFNEAERIIPTIQSLVSCIERRKLQCELIFVDDGSSDNTGEVIATLMDQTSLPWTLCVHHKNKGKGAAVRTGVMAAQGKWVVFMDADNSTAFSSIDDFDLSDDNALYVGSRYVHGARITSHQSIVRRWISRLGNWIIQLVLLPGVKDSQCGFKVMNSVVSKSLFAQLGIQGFGFDFEILGKARDAGLAIIEVPVEWNNHKESKVRLFRDPLLMFWQLGTCKIRLLFRR